MHDVCGMDASAAKPATRLFFEADLRPHRSLSRGALLAVLGAMAAGSLYVTTLMYLLGAWPVIGFNGADLALAALLFWLNARAARAREIIRLNEDDIEITRITPAGRRSVVAVPAGWARAELEEHPGTVPRLSSAPRPSARRLAAPLVRRRSATLPRRSTGRWRAGAHPGSKPTSSRTTGRLHRPGPGGYRRGRPTAGPARRCRPAHRHARPRTPPRPRVPRSGTPA